RAGDTIRVRPGVYREAVRIRTSGLPGAAITFRAQGPRPLDTPGGRTDLHNRGDSAAHNVSAFNHGYPLRLWFVNGLLRCQPSLRAARSPPRASSTPPTAITVSARSARRGQWGRGGRGPAGRRRASPRSKRRRVCGSWDFGRGGYGAYWAVTAAC